MPRSTAGVSMARFELQCERCGYAETIDVEISGVTVDDTFVHQEELPGNWHELHDALTGRPVVFHTQRCAAGWYRAQVQVAWGSAEPGPGMTEPFPRRVTEPEQLALDKVAEPVVEGAA